MKRMTSIVMGITFAASMALSGCVVRSTRPGHHSQASSGRPSCGPSQHWDGNQCRHNGKGHGARKHDGR